MDAAFAIPLMFNMVFQSRCQGKSLAALLRFDVRIVFKESWSDVSDDTLKRHLSALNPGAEVALANKGSVPPAYPMHRGNQLSMATGVGKYGRIDSTISVCTRVAKGVFGCVARSFIKSATRLRELLLRRLFRYSSIVRI